MVRRIFQDVVPPKRSIRDISLDEERALERKAIAEFRKAHSARIRMPQKKSSWFLPFFVLAIAILVGAFFFLSVPKVTITYSPKQISVPLAFDFLSSTSTHAYGLVHTPIVLEAIREQKVVTENRAKVERRAGGTIVIYNAYTSENQRLIKNTRFQAPNGKIFRIKDSVIIPGYKMGAQGKIPGSAEAEIAAESAGEEYNVGKVDFSIPGFVGTPRATLVYARAKTDISGGFTGTAPSPTEAELQSVLETLGSQIKTALISEFNQKNPTQVLIPGAYQITTKLLPLRIEKESVTAVVSGVLSGITFDRNELAGAIAKKALVDFDGSKVDITNPTAISFATKISSNKPTRDIAFTLSGKALLEWAVDTDELQNVLLGAPRAVFLPTITKTAGIQKAEVVISPFWATKFPTDETLFEFIRN